MVPINNIRISKFTIPLLKAITFEITYMYCTVCFQGDLSTTFLVENPHTFDCDIELDQKTI